MDCLRRFGGLFAVYLGRSGLQLCKGLILNMINAELVTYLDSTY
jgi:hypothetical protein